MKNNQNITRVRCDSCKRYLNINVQRKCMNIYPLKVTYFQCAKCGVKYLICIDDFQTTALKQKVRRLQSERNPENHDKIKGLKKEISEHENELRERYKSELAKEGFFNLDGQIDIIN